MMIRPRRLAAQQRRGRERAHSLGSILSRAYAAPVLQPPQQARSSPRIAAASKRPKGCLTLGKSTAVAAAAVAVAMAACSPTAGRRHRTRRCGHWGNTLTVARVGTVYCSPSPKHNFLPYCSVKRTRKRRTHNIELAFCPLRGPVIPRCRLSSAAHIRYTGGEARAHAPWEAPTHIAGRGVVFSQCSRARGGAREPGTPGAAEARARAERPRAPAEHSYNKASVHGFF